MPAAISAKAGAKPNTTHPSTTSPPTAASSSTVPSGAPQPLARAKLVLSMPRWLNLPNALTFARLLLTPFVIKAILDGRHTLALALFAVAAVTDLLDGAAA